MKRVGQRCEKGVGGGRTDLPQKEAVAMHTKSCNPKSESKSRVYVR